MQSFWKVDENPLTTQAAHSGATAILGTTESQRSRRSFYAWELCGGVAACSF